MKRCHISMAALRETLQRGAPAASSCSCAGWIKSPALFGLLISEGTAEAYKNLNVTEVETARPPEVYSPSSQLQGEGEVFNQYGESDAYVLARFVTDKKDGDPGPTDPSVRVLGEFNMEPSHEFSTSIQTFSHVVTLPTYIEPGLYRSGAYIQDRIALKNPDCRDLCARRQQKGHQCTRFIVAARVEGGLFQRNQDSELDPNHKCEEHFFEIEGAPPSFPDLTPLAVSAMGPVEADALYADEMVTATVTVTNLGESARCGCFMVPSRERRKDLPVKTNADQGWDCTSYCSGRGRCGAVLMEYVFLGTVLMAFLVGIGRLLFDPSGGRPGDEVALFDLEGASEGSDFGLVGNAMMDWYHRIVDTVALPVP